MKSNPVKIKLPKWRFLPHFLVIFLLVSFFIILFSAVYINNQFSQILSQKNNLENEISGKNETITNIQKELDSLKNEDQFKVNAALKKDLAQIHTIYNQTVDSYESLLKLKNSTKPPEELDNLFTKILVFLSNKDLDNAGKTLKELNDKIAAELAKLATPAPVPASVPSSNTPPSAGYSRQTVNTSAGSFVVSLVAADMSSTRVIVDTASNSDCQNDCPVLPLGDYVARNGAFAGINGSYFCPASYPSCAGKTNTFDLLVMNKNKTYFNSNNNVYSTNPAVIFGNEYIRFVGQALEWGRDTGIDSMLSNYPMLVQGGNIAYSGSGDPKITSRGNRSFVANKDNQVFIGVVHNAAVSESAQVLKALNMENALNLDDGGSTALWSGSYKLGPGRNLPNVILFVKK